MRRESAHAPGLPPGSQEREAPVLQRDEDVASAHLGDRVEREEVVVVLELLPDELLRLTLVRRDEVGPATDTEP